MRRPTPILPLIALACATLLVRVAVAAEAAPATAPAANAASPDAAAALAERDAAYRTFRDAFAAGRYAEALPLAERVVALTERHATDPAQLPSALNNLGATHYRLGDWVAAEQAYSRALRLVEEQQGAASKRLLAPLRGLALTYQAGGRKDAAAPLLERAVAISRRTDGLFNPDQLELIDPLIDSYTATGRWLDADDLHQYAFRLNERRYGPGSARLAPSLSRLATWYEQTKRYTQARRTWARMYQVSTQRGDENVGGAVNALRGMARTYRLEYQYGPEEIEETAIGQPGQVGMQLDMTERDPFGRKVTPGLAASDYRLDPQGREFLEAALETLRKTDPPSPQAEAVVLTELGDWALLADREGRAWPFYEQAWARFPAQDPGVAEAPRNPLLYPAPLLYRPPGSARRFRDRPADAVVERVAVAEFTVDADGRVRDARVVEGDATESQRTAFLNAIGRAVWRPRFVDGKPVTTENVRYRETFREPKAPPTDAG